MRIISPISLLVTLLTFSAQLVLAQGIEVPEREEGDGPFERVVLRGGYIIDGTGAPAYGPADVVIENDRITQIAVVGTPGRPIDPEGRPEEGDREIDTEGKYILPGFVDVHSHIHSLNTGQNVTPEYIFKLQLSHGITTIRSVGSGGIERIMDFKVRSE
ncbi:MAG: amidohydrolase, partial [Pseudomonadota bacterium]|nr:amidohydrolase [Pseudomonadota bacterium]